MSPEDLNLNGFTHLNFAFAFFDPSTFQISPMDANSASLYSRFTALKANFDGLKTWVSVGGWSFTDRELRILSASPGCPIHLVDFLPSFFPLHDLVSELS